MLSVGLTSPSLGKGIAQNPNCLFTSSSLNSLSILSTSLVLKSLTFNSLFAIKVAAPNKSPVAGASITLGRLGPSVTFSISLTTSISTGTSTIRSMGTY